MPRGDGAPDVALGRAALAVEERLRVELGPPPVRLDAATLASTYPGRRFVRGWRIEVEFSDGERRRIDLLVKSQFPSIYPRTALVDRPEHMTWPHVEHDGILCLLPIMAEVDSEDPAGVALNLLSRSARLVEELLAGHIVDRDFREEFLTYWFYGADHEGPRIESLVRPEPPSRLVRAWRDGSGGVVVGEDHASLERWLRNRRGIRGGKPFRTEPAVLLWMPTPPLPSQYPVTGAHILDLATSEDDLAVLVEAAAAIPEEVLVLATAPGRGGPGLVAMTTTAARKAAWRSGRVEEPLTKGFRAGTIPPAIAAGRTYSALPVLRSNVKRADPEWIHGRGKDPRTAVLLARTCTVIGCGSVGSSVAARLARAGIGRLMLVDPDDLEWSNLGRHELGAQSIGLNKAEELAKRLSGDFPHLDIQGLAISAHAAMDLEQELLLDSDLILVTTGSWQADGELNRWHVENDRKMPMLYGWAESHASAGHAVVVAQSGGCLRCGVGPTGVPAFEATTWPNGATLEEPACGNHFQPYGAVELGVVVDLIANIALDALLSPPQRARHALWLAPSTRLKAAGGKWTEAALPLLATAEGGNFAEREWPTADCPVCAKTGAARSVQ